MTRHLTHVSVVGAGSVGASIVYASLIRGVAERVSLFDLNASKVRAEVLDLNHGIEFVPEAEVTGGDDVAVCAGADVVVVTAGARQKPGQSRRELVEANAAIFADLIPRLVEQAPDAVILIVTNPVDVLTMLAVEHAGLPEGRVFGSGTVLDSSRLRYLLARRFGVAVQNVHAYVVGEHGDSELVLWSAATIAGLGVEEWGVFGRGALTPTDRDDVLAQVRGSALEIIAGKGATNWAIGLATARILEALVSGERRVLPVTAPMAELGGVSLPGTVAMSIPRIVDHFGAGPPLPISFGADEEEALASSAKDIWATYEQAH